MTKTMFKVILRTNDPMKAGLILFFGSISMTKSVNTIIISLRINVKISFMISI